MQQYEGDDKILSRSEYAGPAMVMQRTRGSWGSWLARGSRVVDRAAIASKANAHGLEHEFVAVSEVEGGGFAEAERVTERDAHRCWVDSSGSAATPMRSHPAT